MNRELEFPEPPPGLAPLRRFRLVSVDGAPELYRLEAVEDAGIRLYLVAPEAYVEGYRPEISAGDLARVGAASADQTRLLLVAVSDGEGTSVNLLAPILVSTTTGTAAQLILDGDWPLRHSLSAA